MKTIILKTILTLAAIAALTSINANAASGDLYVSDNNRIWKFSGSGKITVFADLSNPSAGKRYPRIRGLAFDSAGNLYASILDTSTLLDNQGRILKFASNGTFTVFATGFQGQNLSGIAFDSSGNLWAMGGFGTVFKINAAGAVTTVTQIGPFVTDVLSPPLSAVQCFGIALDKTDNVYVAGTAANTIFRITDRGAVYFARDFLGEGPDFFSAVLTPAAPVGLAFDSNGNLYASTTSSSPNDPPVGIINKFAPDGSARTTYADLSALDVFPRGLAFDSKDNLFVAGNTTNALYEVTYKGDIITVANNSTMPAPGFNAPQYLAFSK